MRTTHILALCLFICIFLGSPLKAQTCGPEVIVDTSSYESTYYLNFGNVSRAKSSTYKTTLSVGQTLVGFTEGVNRNTSLGFYSRFYLAPFPLKVKATQGDLLDRIQVNWEIDALGPSSSDGFIIYRNGIWLVTIDDPQIRSYNDFNVIAGRPYTYCVSGKNLFGESVCTEAIGFQVPNGVVTGWISTVNGTPVPDAEVILTPMQGFSAKFGEGDGAFALQDTTTTPFLPALDHDWTITFWFKTDTSINGRVIGMDSLYFRARPSTNGGIVIAKTAGGTAYLVADFPAGTKHNWHHVALSYDGTGNKHRLYLDGELKAIATSNPVPPPDTINFGALANVGPGNQIWKGRLDEVRIYNRKLDELDFDMVMEGTASSETPNLTHYWKMDEELGVKSYDIVKRQKLFFCGAVFDADRPPVHTASITNEDGYYKIESASYGTGTTFLAKPKKNFYLHRALKFEMSENDYATLPDFPITKKATIEVWVSNAAPAGFQTIISKTLGGQEFRVVLDDTPDGLDNNINVHFNGTTVVYGTLGQGSDYKLLAFTWDSLTHKIDVYKNGIKVNQPNNTFPALAGNWSNPDNPWFLGRQPGGQNSFDGLIDEVAVYDTTLSAATILSHYQNARDINERGLRVYFQLDEGSGTKLNNSGSVLLNGGTTFETEWSPLAAHQIITPHEFAPSTRQVTLNPSVTSVDQVDFVDRSTVTVAGYVRYQGTDCFANNVEILVNGASFFPKVVTDSTGKFIIDFDPGTSAVLTPKFEDHLFEPVSWEIINLSSPVAGILFSDKTTRKIMGQIAGGFCRQSIINANTQCIVKVSSADGCLEQYLPVNNPDGKFTFIDLPPLEKMQVAVVSHADLDIYTAFQNQGGVIADLTKKDSLDLDFIYFAPPEVIIQSGLHLYSALCPKVVLNEGDPVTLNIRLKEHYLGGDCFIDTADFHIINGFADEVADTVMGNSHLIYQFITGGPNVSFPFQKTLQIIGKTLKGVEGDTTVYAVVTGVLAKLNTFTTLMPEIPSLILRDPPGDGSYSFLEENEKICTTSELINDLEIGTNAGVKLLLGGTTTFITAPLGVGVDLDVGNSFNLGAQAKLTYQRLSSHSFETCTSFDRRISTSDEDLIVGGARGADLYMGTAFNIIYGNVDIVDFDAEHCEGVGSTGVQVQPGDFATTFIYSQFFIEGVLIPGLEALIAPETGPPPSAEDALRYQESIDRWVAIVKYNEDLKSKARFIQNLSFDAGTEYEFSETSDTTTAESLTNLGNSEYEVATDFQISANEIGIAGNFGVFLNTSNGGKDESGISKGITTGYVLKDNDPLDAFTFDVGMDSTYKTPVFNIKAGQSSCPWEPGTANREGPNLALMPGFTYTAINVPANEPAAFMFLLGNKSATNEDWTYSLTSIAENNPFGAVIKLNGQPLNYLHEYIVPYGEVDTVTLTVERGPIEYTYDSLWIAEISACEYERHLALSIPVNDDPNFFSGVKIGVHFIRPCSEVKITVPAQQEWVIYPNNPLTTNDDQLTITASGYDLEEPSFSRIQVQYRPAGGDGAWLPIGTRWNPNYEDIPAGSFLLTPNFTNFTWNTVGYEDGPYEIRALAVCENSIPNNNGYSEILKGRIDRQPPALVGTPQPSDGVLNSGDEISFTFNQTINCQDILAAVIDHVNLYNTRTDELILTNVTCGDNKIVIDPTILNKDIENEKLRVDLDDIEDMTGNNLDHADWEFYVDRNELAWLIDSAGITKYEDESRSITVKVHNRGGYPVPFTIEDIPEWVHVSPDAGTLVANEIREIQFTAEDTLDIGWFKDSITLKTDPGAFMSGTEKLPFDVRNICRPPNWEVDPGLYQTTMTLVARIRIDTLPPYGDVFVPSRDGEDQVGAFINGQLRGTAKLIEVPNLPFINQWEAFVTIYGNLSDSNKTVTLELFDASKCLHYPGQISGGGTFNFVANGSQGTPGNPKILENYGSLIHEIPVLKGWNWISFNLGFTDPAINKVLNNIPNPAGDLVKDKTSFATYNNNTWTGSLATIGNTSLYMYQAAKDNTIKITGNAITPASTPIPVVSGWNWIGYIPTYKLTVNAALASLSANATAGDVIKNQTSFAQYVTGVGWVGNLKTLQAPNGYLLKMGTGGTLTYPLQSFTGDEPYYSRDAASLTSFWNVDASRYEHNMTLIGIFQYDQANATIAGMELGAFVGNEIRGVGEAIYIDYLDAYMFFLTCYANTSGEQIHFKLYDAATGDIQNLAEKMSYVPNDNKGSIENPVPFSLGTTGIGDVQSELSFNVQPNPFHDETVCRIELPEVQNVHIIVTDMDGKVLYYKTIQANSGMNSFTWKGCTTIGNPLSNGVYFIRLETDQGVLTKKVVLQR